ncbi:MAG: lytic transglycosylase domain-containing protein [Clostridiaceae bacterium]|nr:lytic transglycosylase domain-containing protein [Clostridiaceae bacterium]
MRHFKKTAALLLTTAVLFTGKMTLDLNVSGNEAKTAIIHVEQIHTEKREPEPTARIYSIPLADELQEYTFGLCKENDLDYEMVLAMMDRESDYREKMISKTNDYGLMQINEVNHGWLKTELGIEDFLDAEQNILAGVRMLSELTGKYEDPHQALMAYNSGEAGAKRLWGQGKTTSEYSRSIMARAEELRKEAEGCQSHAASATAH